MNLPLPSITAVSITSFVGAGGGAGLLTVEVPRSRRMETPLLTVTRRDIKFNKSKSDKYGSDMRTKVVRGNTGGIAKLMRNERHMKASKATKVTKNKGAKNTNNKAAKSELKVSKSQHKAAKGGIQGLAGGDQAGVGGDIRGIFEIAVAPLELSLKIYNNNVSESG